MKTLIVNFCILSLAAAQPRVVSNGDVEFIYRGMGRSVVLAGDFNNWSKDADTLSKDERAFFSIVKSLGPGVYQYKFFVDNEWVLDDGNPAKVLNYDGSSFNSIFTVTEANKIEYQGYSPSEHTSMSDTYPQTGGTLYLNLIWHQHQPLYLDPATDQLQGPWVRTHGTKDYYDMAAILERYPDVHYNVNLTSSLLLQLQEYYVNRLQPFVDVNKDRVDAKKFFAKWKGKTDPWIDLALKPTKNFDSSDINFLLTNIWNAFGVSDVQIARFPEYAALKRKFLAKAKLSEQEMREVKFWFYLANFDPDFLEQKVRLPHGMAVDLTDIISKDSNGFYRLKKVITEDDCNRIIAETYKVLASIVPIHKKLMYHPNTYKGQIEVVTTPFYHPILPLIFDSDLARVCQPNDSMPNRFNFPHDAYVQVAKAVEYYKRTFGITPQGMWPAEGAVAQEIIPIFGMNGIHWIATDEKILARSKPSNLPEYYPYGVYANHGNKDSIVIVFRDTELSDKIGFTYQNYKGEDAADDFIKNILRHAPKSGEPDRLLTVILDGENAWEWYKLDPDGKEFLNSLYRKLSALFETKQIVTVTMTEYMQGNPKRGVPPHPISSMPRLHWLYPGSWINANYDTWIGEDEENRAWNYLLTARQDLENSSIAQPDPKSPEPREGTKKWFAYRAWEEMYAAEGSDWFWWYGTDQTAPAGDKPFDIAYITHLKNIYTFAKKGGFVLPARNFSPIIIEDDSSAAPKVQQGAMAQSRNDSVSVVFQCDARNNYVRKAIYIAGNQASLGNWTPNNIRMYDDGSHGDDVSGDSIWTIELKFPVGTELEYKFTNSGPYGQWSPGEEFPGSNRKVILDGSRLRVILKDTFGRQ
jgi:alpha-amylase/alpha-mannosidase (GH57 family)